MVEVLAFRSWTYLVQLGRLEKKCFKFGLIHAEYRGLLPPVEDLCQKVLCSAAKVCTVLEG